MLKASDLPAHLQERLNLKKRANKYHVSPKEARTCDGIVFDSKAEMRRYQQLALMVKSGAIRNLQLQMRCPLVVKGTLICTYVADFYYRRADDTEVIEDVKGMKTPVYRLKKKLFEALYGTKITEVR